VAREFRLDLFEKVNFSAFAKLVGGFLLKLTLKLGQLLGVLLSFPEMLRVLGNSRH
jgi:hypothetical protein